jgi:hypothetical protein
MTMTPYNPDLTRSLKWMQNNAPNIQAIIQAKQTWYTKYNTGFWNNWEENIFNLETANAFGLVVWCIILGLPLDIFVFDPITNAFAYGAQRGNFLDGGGNVAPIQFVGTTLAIQSGGVTVPPANWSLNETSDAITFTAPPNEGAALTWTGTVTQQNTGQTMIVQQPRQFGTGTGVQTVFSLIPSDSENYNQVGNNFYGGGSNVVGLLSEIRYACQLRYIALVSNGRQQWINQMLQYIFNNGQPWNFPGKEYFYLTDNTMAAQNVTGGLLALTGWGGALTPMSSTSRTNLISTNTGIASASGWVVSNVTKTTENGPDGVANGAVLLTPSSAVGTVTGPSSTVSLNTIYVCSVFVEPGTATQSKVACGPATATITWGSTPSIAVTGGAGQASIAAAGATGWYRVQFTFNSGNSAAASTIVTPDPTGANKAITIAYPQVEAGVAAGLAIRTSGATASQTDYTLNLTTGAVVTGFTPPTGAELFWSGTWQWATTQGYQQFGTGNGSNVDFTLTPAPGAIPPLTANNYMEYRVGANMGLSSQFLTLLNNPAYGIMPQCAGTAYAVVQES